MPWTKTNYPNSMKNLPAKVRNKAIEIANIFKEEKTPMGEGILIATSINKAKEWVANHGSKTESISKGTHTENKKVKA
jgi:uncharacterized protein YdaT